MGDARSGTGVTGASQKLGVSGVGDFWQGHQGTERSPGQAIVGVADSGTAVIGTSQTFGVVGVSDGGKGVEGRTVSGNAVVGVAETGTAVTGISNVLGVVGVSESGVAVEGRTTTGKAVVTANGLGGRAGYFSGDVEVIGDILLPVPTEGIQMATVSLAPEVGRHREEAGRNYPEKLVRNKKNQGGYRPAAVPPQRVQRELADRAGCSTKSSTRRAKSEASGPGKDSG